MTRQEYLSELNTHLMSLSAEERENAVRFYDEYFEDAGPANEQVVIEELGKPFALAKSIICEQSEYSKSRSYAKYRESKGLNGSAVSPVPEPDTTPDEPDIMLGGRTAEQPHTQYTAYNYGAENKAGNDVSSEDTSSDTASGTYDTSYEAYKENYSSSASSDSSYSSSNSDNTAVFILGLVFGIIFGIPLILMMIFVFIALGFAAVACAVCTVVLIIVGAIGLFSSVGAGMIAIGGGIAAAGLGLLFSVPTVLGFGKLIPGVFKAIGKFFKKYSKGVI